MSQRYLLDTNVVSHIMQGRDADLLARLTQLPVGQVVISSITLAELEYGLHRKGQPVRLRNALTQVLLRMDVLP
jgi:tRNA(fMet)-specific endonuclease VapC